MLTSIICFYDRYNVDHLDTFCRSLKLYFPLNRVKEILFVSRCKDTSYLEIIKKHNINCKISKKRNLLKDYIHTKTYFCFTSDTILTRRITLKDFVHNDKNVPYFFRSDKHDLTRIYNIENYMKPLDVKEYPFISYRCCKDFNNVRNAHVCDILKRNKDRGLVSCTMVIRDGSDGVKNAIKYFNQQLYKNKELVIVCEDDEKTEKYVSNIKQNNIRFINVSSSKNLSLGELRNISIQESKGTYIAQWNNNDWYHCCRITVQVETLYKNGVDISLLGRFLCVWSDKILFTVSNYRKERWEPTMVIKKSKIVEYGQMKKKKDTHFINMCKKNNITIDVTDDIYNSILYIYNVHTCNTYDEIEFNKLFSKSRNIDKFSNFYITKQQLCDELKINYGKCKGKSSYEFLLSLLTVFAIILIFMYGVYF